MTQQALAAARFNIADIDEVIDTLTDTDWEEPSACPGWRVIDVIAHLGASATSIVEPPAATNPSAQPRTANRERGHDRLVNARRSWTRQQVVDEWREKSPRLLDTLESMQDGPAATRPVEVPGLGVYPAHLLANALAFDSYCHLRNDLLAPYGPVEHSLPEPTDAMLVPVIEWMMAGLPQMQGKTLDETVTVPITLELTGPGASAWTVHPASGTRPLTVTRDRTGSVTVMSTAADFIRWATNRTSWRPYCTITGDRSAVEPFLYELNII